MPSPWTTNHGPYPSAAVADAKFKLLLIFKSLHEGQPREMVVQNFPSQVPPPGAVKQNFIQS